MIHERLFFLAGKRPGLIDDLGLSIELRQSKHLNNLIEQDHRAIKRRLRPNIGCKSFGSAGKLIVSIETMHMIIGREMSCPEGSTVSAADQLYSLGF